MRQLWPMVALEDLGDTIFMVTNLQWAGQYISTLRTLGIHWKRVKRG